VRLPEKEHVISRKVFAGNLSFDISNEDLIELFSAVGPVTDVSMPVDRATGRKRGFAFVEFESEEDAAKAIEALNGKDLAGRPLRVDEAKERSFRPPPHDGRGGGGGGGGGFQPPFDPSGRPLKRKGSRRGIRGRKRGF
jgi:RNA recognition motif-containing protein